MINIYILFVIFRGHKIGLLFLGAKYYFVALNIINKKVSRNSIWLPEIVFRSHKIVPCSHDIVFRSHEVILRVHEIVFRSHEILFNSHEIVFSSHEIVFVATMYSF